MSIVFFHNRITTTDSVGDLLKQLSSQNLRKRLKTTQENRYMYMCVAMGLPKGWIRDATKCFYNL